MRAFPSLMAAWLLVLAVLAAPAPVQSGYKGKVPSSTMKAAYLYHRGNGLPPAPALAQNTLRILVLTESSEFVAKNRTWVAKSDWRQDFKDLFDTVIRWKREALAKGPDHIYRLSQEYGKRPGASKNQFDSLSYYLLKRAARMGHAQAKAELKNRRHPIDEPGVRERIWARNYSQAMKNNWRAQIYVAQEYLMSRHLEKDPIKAYYWFLRAQAIGRDISAYLPFIGTELSPSQWWTVKDWIDKGVVPDLLPAAEKSSPGKVPASEVRSAHIFSLPLGGKADLVLAENILRYFALQKPDDLVDRNLVWVRQSGWKPEFMALFVHAIKWARQVRRESPGKLYQLSRQFRAKSKVERKQWASVADALLRLAANSGHIAARREAAEILRTHKSEWSPRQHAGLLSRVGKGDPGAMILLSTRYWRAEGLKRDLAKAYYWLLRARQAGGGKKADLAIRYLDRRIPAAEVQRAMRWFVQQSKPEL